MILHGRARWVRCTLGILRQPFPSTFAVQHVSIPAELAPGPEARAHSAALLDRVRDEVRAAGGWLPFDRYMELVLYTPGLGYYAGGSAKFGGAGDFVTAPAISPLFGQALATQVADVLSATDGDVLELGPGTGRLAVDVLTELDRLGRLPRRYLLLELSGELRARQEALLDEQLPDAVRQRVAWLDALPDRVEGCVLANEVLDAVPVSVVSWTGADVLECGVTIEDHGPAWSARALAAGPLREAVQRVPVEPPYTSEIGLRAAALVSAVAERLASGAVVFVDYGFGRGEYYHPQRSRGTLMCHYRHRAHDDPFLYPGLQDITAHVDFSAVAEAGLRAGLSLAGYTTQAHFLINCGITDLLARIPPTDVARYLPRVSEVQKLVSPAEMGELFKAIGFTRGIDPSLRGFARGGLERML
ncbi:MAG: class I SAM-dependent methyltransferase [Betaproteobacteria bacterium]|nr:class I SAM-dependent methyltransferase [Betaproteobacteria bacterium]